MVEMFEKKEEVNSLIENSSYKLIEYKFNEKKLNKRKDICRPNKEELLNLLKNETFESIGRHYGVSGNAVKKWCKNYYLPSNVKDIKKEFGLKKRNVNYVEPSLEIQREKYINNISGYKGVIYTEGRNLPYRSKLYIGGKYKYLGSYKTAKEAAISYDNKVIELLGEKAVTNKKLGLI
jgi:hypothetical protein